MQHIIIFPVQVKPNQRDLKSTVSISLILAIHCLMKELELA